MAQQKRKLFADFTLEHSTAEAVAAEGLGNGEKLVQLNLRVPESFWREFHDFCRFNDLKKVHVITDAVKRFQADYGR